MVSGTSNQTSTLGAQNNGQGYDGKLYVRTLPSGVCPDKSNVSDKIVIHDGGGAFVVRANCAVVPETQVTVTAATATTISYVSSGKTITLTSQSTNLCTSIPASIPAPFVDVSAETYAGSGALINQGSGGTALNFGLGDVGGAAANIPGFMTTEPKYFSFDNGNQYLINWGYQNTATGVPYDTIQSWHRKGAKYSMTFEGFIATGDTQILISNGSWSNTGGIGLFVAGGGLFFQVGNGGSQSYTCSDYNSLCLTGPTFGNAVNLFAGISVDESANVANFQGNGSVLSTNGSYSVDSTAPMGHPLAISGYWANNLTGGARVYRVRLWDSTLSSAQLAQLYAQSTLYCPW